MGVCDVWFNWDIWLPKSTEQARFCMKENAELGLRAVQKLSRFGWLELMILSSVSGGWLWQVVASGGF